MMLYIVSNSNNRKYIEKDDLINISLYQMVLLYIIRSSKTKNEYTKIIEYL